MKRTHVFLSIIIIMLVLYIRPLNYVYAGEESDPTETSSVQEEPAAVPSVPADWYTDYEYYIDGSVLKLTDYTGTNTELFIPSKATIDGVEYSIGLVGVNGYDKVTSISFEKGVILCNYGKQPNIFNHMPKLKSLDLSNLDTSAITIMNSMFDGCTELTEINLSGIDTSNVTSMNLMFHDCQSLSKVNLSGFDTSHVTTMCQMFDGCKSLTELDLSVFNTSNVTNMYLMFNDCSSLTELDLSGFNTSKVNSMFRMFESCSGLTKLNLSSFDTSNVTNFSKMFCGCKSLVELDLSKFNTSNASDTSYMFHSCAGLTELDLSSFNTSNVTNMNVMFDGCTGLTKLDLSSFDTSSVTTFDGMFYGCSSLTELNISKFITSESNNIAYMFKDCAALTELDLSSFNTSNVTKMYYTFEGCSKLTALDLSNFDASNATDMSNFFSGCDSLTYIKTPKNVPADLSIELPVRMTDEKGNAYNSLPVGTDSTESIELAVKWGEPWSEDYDYNLDHSDNTITLTEYKGTETEIIVPSKAIIKGAEYQVKLGLKAQFDASKGIYEHDWSEVTSLVFEKGVILPEYCKELFCGCNKLQELDITNLDTTSVKDMSYMFWDCSSLTKLDLSNLNTTSVKNMSYMFHGCSALTQLDLRGFDTSNVTSMGDMFSGCSSLSELDLSDFDTSNVTDMNGMFINCSSLIKLDISGFNTKSVCFMGSMFKGCSSLTELDLSNFNTPNVTDMNGMFYGCSGLTKLDLSSFNTSNVTNMGFAEVISYGMFSGCSGLTELDLSSFDTSNVVIMAGMFWGCSGLKKVNLSSFDTSSVRAVCGMFKGCKSLTELDLGSFDLSNIKSPADLKLDYDGFSELFDDCIALEKISTPKAINTSLSASLPKEMYELKEANKLGEVAYSDLCKAPAKAILVSEKYVSTDPTVPTALSVTQADGVYGTALAAPAYVKPETEGTETLSYTGTIAKDGSVYGPTATAPELPGKYTVTVTYKTDSLTYSGSAEFVIAKADWAENKVRTKGTAGVDGRFDLSKKIAEGAKLGAVTVTKGTDLLEKDPHLSGTLLEWRIKETSTTIDISLSIPATGADNYNDYTITVNILGDSTPDIDGKILLNGKEVSSFKEALSRMTDAGTDYVLSLGVDVQQKGLTLPKTAKSITIYGYGHTLEIIGTKLTANVPLSLERINIKAVKKNGLKTKLSLTAKKDLKIGSGITFTTTSTSITCNRLLTLSSALDAKTVKANDLTLDRGAALKAAGKNSITIKGTLKGNGGAIELGKDFCKPVILKDSVDGTVNITGEKQPDGTQILKCSAKKISAETLKKAFNVSAVTPNGVDTYLYYFGSGKAGIFGESISYNGIKYGVWKDAVTAMNTDFKNGKQSAFVVELIGDVNMKGAFKLPSKGYESITITGNNSVVTFTGNIKLTGNTTIKNITLNKTDKKGNKISGTVNKGKYTYDGPESF